MGGLLASVFLQFLGQHHEDAAGTAEVREFVDVGIGRHAPQRMASVLCGYLEGLIDVIYREGHAVHADVVGARRLRLDRLGMDVFEELKPTVTVRGLEHRNFGVVSIKSNGSIGPLAADRVPAHDRKTEIGEKGDSCFDVANSDAHILKFDGHALKATKAERLAPVARRHRKHEVMPLQRPWGWRGGRLVLNTL